jgi:peptide/nickel transport system substrate-binding protein
MIDIHKLSRRGFLSTAAGGLATALATPALAQAKDSLVMSWQVDPPTWDPIIRTNPGVHSIMKMVFDQPLSQAPDLKIIPAVVKSWKLADDAKQLELELRDDVYWHDGQKLTTADFRYTYLERRQKGLRSDLGTVFRLLTDVQIASETKCTMIFSEPMPSSVIWLAFLANFIVPKHYVEAVGSEKFAERPIGSGPYKLVQYERNSRVVLEAFDKYWGPKPSIKKVTILIMKDPSARVAAVQSGQSEWVPDIPIREVERLQKVGGLKGEIQPITRVILLQVRNDKAFSDKNVRLAAHHAIDKAALSRAFYAGKAVPLSIPVTPSTPGYVADYKFEYDPKKAEALLAKSGFGPNKPVRIDMATFNGVFPGDYEIARAIGQMWRRVGIEAKLEVIEQPKYFELNRGNQLPEATLYSWDNATGDAEFFVSYILNPKLPFSTWKDPEMGERLQKLAAVANYEERIKGYRQIAVDAAEQGATIPLLQSVITAVYKDGLKVTTYGNGWALPQTWAWG